MPKFGVERYRYSTASNFCAVLPSNGSLWVPLPPKPSLLTAIQISCCGVGVGVEPGVPKGVAVGVVDGDEAGVAEGVGVGEGVALETMVPEARLGVALL